MGGLKFFRLVELPAPRQEDYFGGVFRFVRVWVGPHSAWKFKTILLANLGPQINPSSRPTKNFSAPNYFEKMARQTNLFVLLKS